MGIKNLVPEELRQFIQSHHEKTYTLIDVRQPEEYEQGHIPGALLLPLPDLIQTMESLPADKRLVFYCHSGGRSMAAASMVAEEGIGDGDLINLDGGILAWDGGMVPDYPKVELFDHQAKPSDMLKTAMNLEKGALKFYSIISQQFSNQPWVEIFSALAKAEIGHAKIVYRYYQKIETQADEFDIVFDQLDGEVLEGGVELKTVIEKAFNIKGRECLGLIEMALQIEYAAYDLYRVMAERITISDAQEAFIAISQAEKMHMRSLGGAIAKC